jgi:hypothetical protein
MRIPDYYAMPVQPIDFIVQNDLGFVEGCIVKYICRYDMKGGNSDLEKIKHYCDILIERNKENERG